MRRVAKCTLMCVARYECLQCVCAPSLCLIFVGIQKIYKYLCSPLAVALKQDPLASRRKRPTDRLLECNPRGAEHSSLSHLEPRVEPIKMFVQSRGFLKPRYLSSAQNFSPLHWLYILLVILLVFRSSFFLLLLLQHPSVLSDRNVCFVVSSTVFVFAFFSSSGFTLLDFCLFR